MAFGGGSKGIKNEINITPLVDVVLVLLIIFMVITPMLSRGKDVVLPQAKEVEEQSKDSDPLILSVTDDKKIWIETDGYADDAGFMERVKTELTAKPDKKIQVKADSRLKFGDVRHAMELARKAGARGVSLAVEELKKK